LEELVGPGTRGDPMSPLRWTLKSTGMSSDNYNPPSTTIKNPRLSG